ncbi:hypothetical protein B0T21DRAFT_367345 [Apiosordaria backusii]|uniref:Uncharacterized protein n=1 Tax=Apiosordaria backusii TaxID=314023 RepID=A0AA40BLY8_9PEZI|nr:hypothetical protein B0T21DRAFT_367345 [Apiosordaria backusii]
MGSPDSGPCHTDMPRLGWLRSWVHQARRVFTQLIQREFQTCYRSRVQVPTKLRVKKESELSVFCTWVTSIATVSHIIYGTLIFSSILFVSTSDAIQIVARFVTSTVICRVILVFEIAGMQQSIEIVTDFGNSEEDSEMNVKMGGTVEVKAVRCR